MANVAGRQLFSTLQTHDTSVSKHGGRSAHSTIVLTYMLGNVEPLNPNVAIRTTPEITMRVGKSQDHQLD